MGSRMVPARQLLQDFIKRNALTLTSVGHELGVTYVAVRNWLIGHTRPNAEQRVKIAMFTDGAIPAHLWRTSSEQVEIDAIKPFRTPNPAACIRDCSQPKHYHERPFETTTDKCGFDTPLTEPQG